MRMVVPAAPYQVIVSLTVEDQGEEESKENKFKKENSKQKIDMGTTTRAVAMVY